MTHRDDDTPLDDAIDLETLRAAFNALPVPDATPRLDQCDHETKAAVAWMTEAFAALAVPAVDVPKFAAPDSTGRRAPILRLDAQRTSDRSRTRPGPRPRPRPSPWLRHAAAAAVFAALALGLWWARHADQIVRVSPDGPPVTADADAAPTPDAIPASIPSPIPGFREASPASSGLVAVTSDHLEVSSGPVRLVLMTFGSSRAGGPSLDLP